MRKLIIMLVIGLLAAAVWAREEGPQPITEATPLAVDAEVSLFSAYVSRGQVSSDRPVVEPQVKVEKNGFTLMFWGNFELTDRNDARRKFNEVDLFAGYAATVGPVDLYAGVAEYLYPNTSTEATDADGQTTTVSEPSTRELFIMAEAPNLWVKPSIELYYDFGEADGFYAVAALEKTVTLLDRLTLTPGFSTGWGSAPYNDYFFDRNQDALNDGNVFATLTYAATDAWQLSGTLACMWLWDASVRAGANDIYYDDQKWWGGLTAAYSF